MRRGKILKTAALALGIAALVLVVGVLVHYKLPTIAWYWVKTHASADEARQRGLWLPAYRVSVEARPIAEVRNNLSGLTFNRDSGTLFAVVNQPAQIVELDTEGRLLRRVAVAGAEDLEGISHVYGEVFILADERRHHLYRVTLDARQTGVDLAQAARFELEVDPPGGNRGLEGLSWDEKNQRLFVVKEKTPLRVLAVSGPSILQQEAESELRVAEWRPVPESALFVKDLSSIEVHEVSGNLLLLSDESALVAEYDIEGRLLSMLPLWPGLHGLQGRIPRAEGIAIGPDGSLYVVSEPNLFYRFEREAAPR
ncbi:MAG: SdiA-regulated domain-containing protein [Azonexus sp.]